MDKQGSKMVTRTQIIELLKTNDKAIARALVVLNERQTTEEQNSQQTRNNNGRGFTPADAYMGTSMALGYLKYHRLTEKQIAYWRKPNAKGVPRICKYAGQLLEVAEAKQAHVTQQAPVTNKYMGSDVGNMAEEYIVLDEQIAAFQEGAYGDGPEVDEVIENMFMRQQQIREAMEEVQRCEYKMKRDFA